MDNFTHSLAGWALGQTGLKVQSRKGLAALILGANMPDIDVFFGSVPWEPLAMHRGFTHGLVGGVVVMPPILFGLLMLLDRWQLSRRVTFKSGLEMRPGWLLALCYIGAISHPSLDLLTTYSVQLLSPFSGLWFHADALFIVDVWLWVLLATTIEWSRWRQKAGGNWQRPTQVAVAIFALYVAGNLLITRQAKAAVRSWAGERQVEAIFASPPPVQFWRRGLVWREGDCYRRSRFDPLGGRLAEVSACDPIGFDDPAVAEVIRRHPEVMSFLRWSVMPQASVTRSRCAIQVSIGDARYGERGRSRLGSDYLLPTRAAGC